MIKKRIVETMIQTPNNIWYGTVGGNDTLDRVFLLSLEEVDTYFGNSRDYLNKKRKTVSFKKVYPDRKGNVFSNIYDNNRIIKNDKWFCWWWLRSPGERKDYAAGVRGREGHVSVCGNGVNWGGASVRPAMWIKI
jgi:hypothetical protein